MKKITKVLMLFSAVLVLAISKGKAQEIIVRERLHRPGRVIVARPLRPSPRHVWVSEEWTPSGGTYAYHAGYWAVPARDGAVWVPGHWANRHRGYVWIPGHWR